MRHTWAAHDGTVWRRVCRTSDRLALFVAESQDRRHGRRVARGGGRPDRPDALRCRPARGHAAGGRRGDGAPALPAARGRPRGRLPAARRRLARPRPRVLPRRKPTSSWSSRTGSTSCARPPAATCRSMRRRWPASRRRAGSRRTRRRSRACARSRPARRSRSDPGSGRRCEPELARRPMPLVTPGEGPVTPALVEEATAGLTATARRIGALGGPIDLALSGGKDSRLLAAAFFEAGVEAQLYTRAVYDDEAAIAVELVRRLGPGHVRHDIVGHGDTAGGFSFSDVPVDPLASARYLVSFSGGLYDPVYVGQLDAGGLGTPGVSGTPTVHGGLGEIAHNIYYPASTSPEEERDDPAAGTQARPPRGPEGHADPVGGAGGPRRGGPGLRRRSGARLRRGPPLRLVLAVRALPPRMNPVPAYFDHLLPFADLGLRQHGAVGGHLRAPGAPPAPGADRRARPAVAGRALLQAGGRVGRAGARSRRGRGDRVAPHGRRVPAAVLPARDGSRRPSARWRPGRPSGRTGTSSSGPSGCWPSGPSSATGRSAGPAAPSVSGRAWPRSGASRDAGAGLSGSDDSGTRGAGRRREPRASDAGPRP